MTLWGRFFRPQQRLPLRQERWKTPDGDTVTLVRLDAPPPSPRVVILHGLEGSARSHYVQGVLAEARRRGWGADVLVFRTCDGRGNVCRRTYHSGETADLDMVVRRIHGEDARRDIALFGVSLGANVALKWLGERTDEARAAVRAAVAVSTPFDLARSSLRISQGLSRIYQRHFLQSLRGKALLKLESYPDIGSPPVIRSVRTLREFDDAFTAPAHGFRDANDYYTRSSSIGYLASIRVPTLLLSARDDPFHPPDVLSDVARLAAANPCLHTEFPQRGGHAGFVEGASPFHPRYYVDRRVGDFFASYFAAGSTRPMQSFAPTG
jgi:predicted alpha/beta-fold hydrolase